MNHSIQYDLGAMKLALIKCDADIKVFEQAIADERGRKKEYRIIIDALEAKLREPKPKVHLEIVPQSDESEGE